MRRRPAGLVLGVVLLAAIAAAFASEKAHRVAPGESASSIARRYYGDYELAGPLLAYNGKAGTVIQAGESLRIPLCEVHAVRAGDSWSVLAQRFLGRADAWPVVALLNGLSPGEPLQVGQRIVFPVVMPHALRSGESLAGLAERYYGDAHRSDVLQRFNAIEDPRRLSVGEPISVPLIVFVPAHATVASEPQEPRPPVAKPPERAAAPEPLKPAFERELRQASLALATGDYGGLAELVARLEVELRAKGTPEERAKLWELATALFVARDEPQRACEAWNERAGVPVEIELDPDLVSPKVRDAIARCAGH